MATANMTGDEKLVDDVSTFISDYIDTRFEGLTPELKVVLCSFGLDMYEFGAQWADNVSGREEKSIILNC